MRRSFITRTRSTTQVVHHCRTIGLPGRRLGDLVQQLARFQCFITDLNPDRSRCHLAMREASLELRFDAINQRHGEEIGKKLDAAGFPDRSVNRDQVFLERQGDRLGGEAGYHFAD